MDARALRTTQALQRAVRELARSRPVDDITVIELTNAAGVSRRTLYNHAHSPQEILTDMLRVELQTVSSDFEQGLTSGQPRGAVWRRGDDLLAAHLLANADIYGAGISTAGEHMSPSLARMLADTFEIGTMPVLVEGEQLDPSEARMTARFISAGLVGAIEAWLATPELDPALLSKVLANTIASWITGITDEMLAAERAAAAATAAAASPAGA